MPSWRPRLHESVVQGTQMLARPPAEALALLAQSDSAEPRAVAHELDRLTAVMRCASPSSQLLNVKAPPGTRGLRESVAGLRGRLHQNEDVAFGH